MAEATGSLAFIGAARFQGYWNASTNEATGSALDGAKFTSTNIGLIGGLFETGSSFGGGYGTGGPNVTASAGDYWQVTSSGTHNTDGAANWNLNDWCTYSGSSSGTGAWRRLAFEDTIASIIIGDFSSSSFHMGPENDKHVIFDVDTTHSGSKNFTYDYTTNQLLLTGNLLIADDKKLYFGASNDVSLEYDEDGTDELRFAGAAVTFEQAVTFDGNVTLGNASSDVTTISSQLTASTGMRVAGDSTLAGDVFTNSNVTLGNGITDVITVSGQLTASHEMLIPDDKKLYFGTGHDASIEYNEDGDDILIISGSLLGLVLSGTSAVVDASAVSFKSHGAAPYATLTSAGLVPGSAGGFSLGSATAELADIFIGDGRKIKLGNDQDAYIMYNETAGDVLVISGSTAGTVISGSAVTIDSNATMFKTAGGAVYLSLSSAGLLPTIAGAVNLGGTSNELGHVYLANDKKLQFGDGQNASIEYDEDGTDELRFAGAAATFEQAVTFDANVTLGNASSDVTTISSQLTASHGMRMVGDTALLGALTTTSDVTLGNGITDVITVSGQLTASHGMLIADDKKLYFGAGHDASFEYDEDNTNKLIISGAAGGFNIDLPDNAVDAFTITQDGNSYITVTTLNGTETISLYENTKIYDDKKLYFGNALDASIEYDEDGADYLVISGSDAGLALSGSSLILDLITVPDTAIAVATDSIPFFDADLTLKRESIADLATAMAGTGLDASSGQLTVDLSEVIASDGANELLTSDGDGTATGESNLTYDGTTFVINDDARVNDDLPLYFGTHSDAYIKYDEAKTDLLIISGSTAGMVLSGSTIAMDGQLLVGPGAATTHNIHVRSATDASIYLEADTNNTPESDNVFIKMTQDGNLVRSIFGLTGADDTDPEGTAYTDILNNSIFLGSPTTGVGIQLGTNDAVRATVEPGGNVGIATTAPEHTLSVTGTFGVSGDVTLGDAVTDVTTISSQLTASSPVYFAGNAGFGVTPDSSHALYAKSTSGNIAKFEGAAGMVSLYIGATGRHIISGQSGGSILSISNTGAGDYMALGTNAFVVNKAGTTGIGTAVPEHTLSVTGTFGVSGDVTLGDAITDATTVNSQLTASVGLLVPDDKKLYFGSGHDASIEYDEDGTDTLLYAGASLRISDDVKLEFGAGGDASIRYDEANADKLIISGAAGGFDIDLPDNVANAFTIGEEAAPYMSVITSNSAEAVMFSKDAWIIDDKKLYFGTGKDASIEYDEDGTDLLTFAGADVSFAGLVNVGTGIEITANEADTITATGGSTVTAGAVTQSARKGVITIDLATNSCNIANMATYTVTLTNAACDVDSVVAVTTTGVIMANSHTLSDSGCKFAVTNNSGGAITANFTINYVIL